MTDHATFRPSKKCGLILPPIGRAYWVDKKENSDLAYLSWGLRTFGANPIPMTTHDGWVYTCVIAGSQILVTPEGHRKLNSGYISRVGPDFPTGWSNLHKKTSSRQITWVWRSPPNEAQVPPSSWESVRATQEQVKELIHLHETCRREVARADALTLPLLANYRQVLDLLFQRAGNRTKGSVTESRLQFAISWLEANPTTEKPLEAVCNYLDISASTLERLFRKHFGIPPSTWLYRHRMHRAELLHSQGMRTKEIAYALGYRFPNDLSRARKRWLTDPARKEPRPTSTAQP